MRILHVSSTSTASGANRYAFDLAAGQKDLGHDPVVAMPARPGTALDFRRADIEALVLGSPRALSFLGAVTKISPDILHCHDGTTSRWARWAPLRPPALATLHIGYKRRHMDHFDGVHVLAEWQLPALADFKGARAKINNWAPTLGRADASAIAAARARAGALPNEFLVVSIGRLERVKGLEVLIDALRLAPDARVKAAIVGVGVDEAAIHAHAKGEARVVFTGYSNTPAAWYGAADLVVMPSRRENFALVALEAMACGAPLLVANVGGFGEIFRDRKDCLVAPEDPAALAAAIAERARGKTGTTIVRDSYDMSRFERTSLIAEVMAFYDQVIAHKRAR